jgi:hypothetical protein
MCGNEEPKRPESKTKKTELMAGNGDRRQQFRLNFKKKQQSISKEEGRIGKRSS